MSRVIVVHPRRVPDHDLVARVATSAGLTESEAARVVGDVLAHYAEPVEDFVRRRHAALQLHGARNPQIYRTIAAELRERVVAAPELSERQLRRIIYG
jgi:sulfite reductase beta subunit-like hemoprotein